MPGGHWTRQQKRAYRSAFSIGRIVDEAWILAWLGYFFLWVLVLRARLPHPLNGWSYPLGFLALGLLSYAVLPRLLKATMPDALRRALPEDRFAGDISTETPRTYAELARRWLKCS